MDQLPLWMVWATQSLTICGDVFGQRASRVYWRDHSRLSYLLAMTLHTAVQLLIVGLCYLETDHLRLRTPCTPSTCTPIPCPAQGPASMFGISVHAPLIWATVPMNLLYYTAEAYLFAHGLGVVLIMAGVMTSGCLIPVWQRVFGLAVTRPVSPWAAGLSILAAVLTAVQVPVPGAARWGARKLVSAAVPFVALFLVSSFYFVLQDACAQFRINTWGFNAFDQILLPFYASPMVAVVGAITGVCKSRKEASLLENELIDDFEQDESVEKPCMSHKRVAKVIGALFKDALCVPWQGHVCLTIFRLFHNARAIIYFILTTKYAVSPLFFQLQLARFILSWFSVLVSVLFPKIIGLESRASLGWRELLPRLVGTVAGLGAVLMIFYGI